MLAAIAALALPMPAYASGVIDNVNGIAIGPDGKIVHFGALMIDDEGKVEKLIQGRYQEPEYKPKKPKRGQPWPERPKGPSFKLDAGGKTLIPGLIDAHGHVMGLGLSLITLDLSDTKSLAEAQAKIRAYAQENTGRKWIIGTGWNQETWGLGRFPTAAELDAAVGDIPVWLERIDGHAGWANSAAIRAAGVSAATKAPAGGRIEMAAGKPAGVFVDKAMDLIQKVVPAPAPKDRDNALEKAQRALLAVGITGIADMGTSIEDWQAFRRSADRGALRVRIMSYAYGLDNMVLIAGPEPTPWLYDDHLRMGGIKLLLDGALGSRGAWLKAGYSDAPGQRGLPMIPSTQLRNIMSRAAMDNFQVAVHAIGDAANGEILDAIQEMSDTYSGDRRWRVEHAQIIDPADLPRFARYGTIASMQPVHETSDWRMATARLGEARLKGAYAWKAMLDNKVPLAFGSDVPVESPNPFPGIAAAMSRQDARGEPAGGWMPEQKVSFEAALDGFTRQAAFAGFAEKKFGSLVPGQRADFLLIDRNIETASPTDIRGTQVLETWINGKRVYVKGQ
ncbi:MULTISPECIES: amidohydrolase [Sphingobium]|jgi:predicted amidohydrolase YtcJ|uniref:Metal-dependent hydrolase n=1 Tax=Sphingobium yanoikuyae TaxID=13690 RepID=A0A0J9D3R8_SPHYA|nr:MULTISPECIES: amidohydrolase [Sphingobium]ATP20131.1 metal-dependent hydrolase [Sphingobium yanoikuyae]KMW32107.1 metal-dependent hydrolase [Sphingobium yanoikuyae]TKV40829.1 metal-dependent hydrolase [Sphingobium sp. MP9-4]